MPIEIIEALVTISVKLEEDTGWSFVAFVNWEKNYIRFDPVY